MGANGRGVTEPFHSEALADIFRQEALDHRARAAKSLGNPLRTSAARLQRALWVLVGSMAVCLALAGSLTVDELAVGPAIVRRAPAPLKEDGKVRTTEGAPGEGGGVSVSCRVEGYLQARHYSAIQPGTKARLVLLGSGNPAGFEIELDSADPRRLSTGAVRGLLDDPTLSMNGEPMIEVIGHLDPGLDASGADARPGSGGVALHEASPPPLECPSGRGTVEVRLPPRSLLAALVPGSVVPSEPSR